MDTPDAAPQATPESAEAYYARLVAAADAEGRLPQLSDDAMSEWDIFPYEAASLVVRPLQPLLPEEPARRGEDPATCWCAQETPRTPAAWSNERWVLRAEAGPLPFWGVLQPRAHHDLPDLPPELAAEMGQLLAVVAAGVERLPSVGRAHVSKWGDGGAHLHMQVLGRPARVGQLRGSCLPDWVEHLPQLPEDAAAANIRAVIAHLVEVAGGEAGGPALPR